MSVPVSGMALTGLRELWSAIPFIRDSDHTLVVSAVLIQYNINLNTHHMRTS